MDYITGFFGALEQLTWGWSLVPILVIFGVFITLMTGFVQFRFFGRMFRVLKPKNEYADPNQISARQALMVSVGGACGRRKYCRCGCGHYAGWAGRGFLDVGDSAGRYGNQPGGVHSRSGVQTKGR